MKGYELQGYNFCAKGKDGGRWNGWENPILSKEEIAPLIEAGIILPEDVCNVSETECQIPGLCWIESSK